MPRIRRPSISRAHALSAGRFSQTKRRSRDRGGFAGGLGDPVVDRRTEADQQSVLRHAQELRQFLDDVHRALQSGVVHRIPDVATGHEQLLERRPRHAEEVREPPAYLGGDGHDAGIGEDGGRLEAKGEGDAVAVTDRSAHRGDFDRGLALLSGQFDEELVVLDLDVVEAADEHRYAGEEQREQQSNFQPARLRLAYHQASHSCGGRVGRPMPSLT